MYIESKLGYNVLDKNLIKPPSYNIFDPNNDVLKHTKTMARTITTPRKRRTHSNSHKSPTANAMTDVSGKYDSIISADPIDATQIGRPTLLNRFIITWQHYHHRPLLSFIIIIIIIIIFFLY